MIQSIIKRDGRVVLYDQNKIAGAILKALEASGEGNAADAAVSFVIGALLRLVVHFSEKIMSNKIFSKILR